jgi:release factor glutamine methyltransferase
MTVSEGRFAAIRSDWFAAVEGRFHIIVSNPPYIASDEFAALEREVRGHDPLAALDGGVDGLDAYRAIARGAGEHLHEDGVVAVEIGHDQADAVSAIFAACGFGLRDGARDLGGHVRALAFCARKP